jgi:ABC-type transport system involved in cytochrome bd biosynthesis fused ATPase/permease subunit
MNDDEARYLIDQFNKFASWRVRYFEILFPYLAVSVAIGALYFSSSNLGWERTFVICISLLALLFIAGVIVITRHAEHKEQLVLLEDHRAKYKSLPDTVMLSELLKPKPKKLKRLLQEASTHA